ncbi:MAG: carbohydrate-binding family 9-like protein [Luteitalea sp.]
MRLLALFGPLTAALTLLQPAATAAQAPPPHPSPGTTYAVRPARDAARAALLAGEDLAWAAAETITWVPAPYQTRFRALWSPEGLYLRWDADDPKPWHTMTTRDEHLWEEEVVEIFLDPAWAGKDYWELEINPANVVCDVRMVAPHPTVTSDLAWNHDGLQTAVRHEKKADGTPLRWVATAFAPWAGFRSLPVPASVALPPKAGDAWGFNVFRIERPNGPERPKDGAISMAWSPTGAPSFHVPAAFRKFVFADK